jgi:hypothetical protein
MKYYLFLWITGCVGFGCPIEDYVKEEYESHAECMTALEAMLKVAQMTKKPYAGICLPEDMAERIQLEWDEYNGS